MTDLDIKNTERFFNQVLFTTDCWEWQGHKNYGGYGQISIKGKSRQAHRFSYELYKGKIPDGLQLDHLCRVRNCVNPYHLEAVTPKENTNRGLTGKINNPNTNKTHCKRGHKFTIENTFYRKNGKRLCKECNRNLRRKSRGVIIVGY